MLLVKHGTEGSAQLTKLQAVIWPHISWQTAAPLWTFLQTLGLFPIWSDQWKQQWFHSQGFLLEGKSCGISSFRDLDNMSQSHKHLYNTFDWQVLSKMLLIPFKAYSQQCDKTLISLPKKHSFGLLSKPLRGTFTSLISLRLQATKSQVNHVTYIRVQMKIKETVQSSVKHQGRDTVKTLTPPQATTLHPSPLPSSGQAGKEVQIGPPLVLVEFQALQGLSLIKEFSP